MAMRFALSDEQAALRDSVRRFCERDYGFERRKALLGREEGYSREVWSTFAELGWLGAGLAEEYFGWGGGPAEVAVIQQELGRALVLEPFLPSAVIAARAIASTASDAQREAWLIAVVAGEVVVALAHTEADTRGDDAVVQTIAADDGSGWRLNGVKTAVLGAPSADWLLVSARTAAGLSLFRVDRGAAGLALASYDAVDGRRLAEVTLRDTPGELVGSDGAAQAGIELAVDHGIVALMAECVGAMDAALWVTRDYLLTRKQFGAALASFQALQHRMADALVETELARSMLQLAVQALSVTDAESRRARVAAAKVQIGDAALKVTAEAIQLHGGIGMTEEYIVGHFYKRVVLARQLFGSPDRSLERFAKAMARSTT